ncbi:hypothetical protein HYW82_04135 [Candidatus Peregrinibacteria bacterium]|nr:hypothetical protein [Candidatus Peregrinibacteria bacterium]
MAPDTILGITQVADGLSMTGGLGKKTPKEIFEEIALLRGHREKIDSACEERQNCLRNRARDIILDAINMLLPEGYELLNRLSPEQVDIQEHGIVMTINGHMHVKSATDPGISFSSEGFLSLGLKLQQLFPDLTFSGPEAKQDRIFSWLELEVRIPPDKVSTLLESDPVTKETILGVLGDVKAVIMEKRPGEKNICFIPAENVMESRHE